MSDLELADDLYELTLPHIRNAEMPEERARDVANAIVVVREGEPELSASDVIVGVVEYRLERLGLELADVPVLFLKLLARLNRNKNRAIINAVVIAERAGRAHEVDHDQNEEGRRLDARPSDGGAGRS